VAYATNAERLTVAASGITSPALRSAAGQRSKLGVTTTTTTAYIKPAAHTRRSEREWRRQQKMRDVRPRCAAVSRVADGRNADVPHDMLRLYRLFSRPHSGWPADRSGFEQRPPLLSL